ncbi:MAG: S8 family serine peptidase, partial [Acidobacteria bacterium]|nr:S8 family serine peptidase [Acidobacteriota bacterium]
TVIGDTRRSDITRRLTSNNYTLNFVSNFSGKDHKVAVATMGNTGNTTNTVQYPGSFGQGIIAIGATDQEDTRAEFSTYGSKIDVAAPGVSILSTYRGGVTFSNPDYELLSGTSMAAPHVTGLATLLKGYNSSLYNDDIENIVKLSAQDINDPLDPTTGPGWDQGTGYGRINARKALERLGAAGSGYTLTHASVTGGTDMGASSTYQMVIYGAQAWGLADGNYIVKRHEVRRNVSFSSMTSHAVWGRGVATNGWADEGGVNFSLGWCDAVPGTVTSTGATLRTYVYEVWTILGQSLGYKPTTPGNVQFAYTVHGIPQPPPPFTATIVGPSELQWKDRYEFTVNLSGGSPPYTYGWQWREYPGGAWSGVINTQPTYDFLMQNYDVELKVDVTGGGQQASDTHIIIEGSTFAGKYAASENSIQALPEVFSLSSNYPNPFNPSTQIRFAIPTNSHVRVDIFDILGRLVTRLLENDLSPGTYRVVWNGQTGTGEAVSSGIYIYRITAGDFVSAKKMVMLK